MFPPRSGACACEIASVHTEFLITEYTDRVLVVATQIGKLGTVYHLRRDVPGELSLQRADADALADDEGLARCETLIGRRDDATLDACARRIGEVLFARGLEKPIVCALGLRSGCGLEAKRAVASTAIERASELLGIAQ
ncbi:Proteasome assembly chaperone 3 [Ostreococcus tauri]|uniref:Proteasome assembly chaperone 3 n=1 Tax=Ostreococcus tauri TaxID=70448 RepID=Q00W73_OSTTA|eukprot:XP_003082930.1 Proteasome assembly chaperone 3 [Ostreococcus tauri]